MSEIKKGLSKYLLAVRERSGLSRDKVSRRTKRKTKAQTIYMWESGQSVPDSVKLMEYLLSYGIDKIDIRFISKYGEVE